MADASTTSTLTSMTNSLQLLTEQMTKGFASVNSMQNTVASLTEQLQQERQHSATLREQVSKLEADFSNLSATVGAIQAKSTSNESTFTPSVFKDILVEALGSFTEGLLTSQTQSSMSQTSQQTPKRSRSLSSEQAFTPKSKRLQRNARDLDQCEQLMDQFRGEVPPMENSQDQLPSQATTEFDYDLKEWDDDSPQAAKRFQDRLDQLNQPDEGDVASPVLGTVEPTTADTSSVITITDSSVSAPATQPRGGSSSKSYLASAFVGDFKTPNKGSSTNLFSPVAGNTRQKKPLSTAPHAPVEKQWAGGKH
jgi:uncharacterized phage infection (PIP) family protein YhgE